MKVEIQGVGRIAHPWGMLGQVRGLGNEVAEYFRHGIDVGPSQVVFDVGANIGVFARYALARASNDLRLFCFEPVPELFGYLEANVRGFEQVRRFNLGLSGRDAPESVEFTYFRHFPCDSTQCLDEKYRQIQSFVLAAMSPYLERPKVADMARRGVAFFFDRPSSRWIVRKVVGEKRLQARMTNLSQVIRDHAVERVDLLKIDVEGAEKDILEGLDARDVPKIRQMALEGHDEGGRLDWALDWTRRHGFDFVQADRPAGSEAKGLNNFLLYARRV